MDSQVREAKKGIDYLEERMRELQMRRAGQSTDGQPGRSSGGPPPPAHGSLSPQPGHLRPRIDPPTPPPKDGGAGYISEGGDYGNPGSGGYMNDMSGGHGMMPPRAPFGPPAPGSTLPRTRPNYTKLGQLKSIVLILLPQLTDSRSHQIRYSVHRPSNTTHVFTIGVQSKR